MTGSPRPGESAARAAGLLIGLRYFDAGGCACGPTAPARPARCSRPACSDSGQRLTALVAALINEGLGGCLLIGVRDSIPLRVLQTHRSAATELAETAIREVLPHLDDALIRKAAAQ